MSIECEYCKSKVESKGGANWCPNCTAPMGTFIDASQITAGEICVPVRTDPTLKVFNSNGDCIAVIGTIGKHAGVFDWPDWAGRKA